MDSNKRLQEKIESLNHQLNSFKLEFKKEQEEYKNMCRVKCNFEDNVGEYGGAVDLFKFNKKISHVSIVNCVFKENTARECGGAIFSDYGYLTIKNCKFYQNKASKSGGALEVRSGKLRLIKPVFNSNSAKYGGALLIKNKKSIYSKNAKYMHNKASHGKNILAIYANSVSKLKIIH